MTEKPLGERVAMVEADNGSLKGDVAEIFRLQRSTAEAMHATALQQAKTQQQLDDLAISVRDFAQDTQRRQQELLARVEDQHTPETCPNTCQVRKHQQILWAAGGVLALLASLGIFGELGKWLMARLTQ